MATTVGANKIFTSDEVLLEQSDMKNIGTMVESLLIEFDQAAFEHHLSRSKLLTAARLYRRVSSSQRAKVHISQLSINACVNLAQASVFPMHTIRVAPIYGMCAVNRTATFIIFSRTKSKNNKVLCQNPSSLSQEP